MPEHCTACGAPGRGLCADCVCALRPLRTPCCGLCGAPTAWPVARCRECAGRALAFASARAAVVYGGPARPFVRAWKEHGLRRAAALAVALAGDGRIVDFEEKPADPPSTLAATATYLFHREHARLIKTYLEGEHGADQPGRFVGWLQRHEPVYGWLFDATWYDIGNHEQLLEADNRLRAASGLPTRAQYTPD